MLDISKIKQDFPIFQRLINGKQIVYLDSTASTLKPSLVIEAVKGYYEKYSVNIFRGVYKLSEEATTNFEESRSKIADFIGCNDAREIIFVRNATEAINLVSGSLSLETFNNDSEIVATVMEHHANLVPWQQLAIRKNLKISYIDINSQGILDSDSIDRLVTPKTKVFALTHVSNVLGTINPLKEIIKKVKAINSRVIILVDAAQSVPHMKVNVSDLNCDFLVFSGHKMLGPTGIGVLWGKSALLEKIPPYQMGGEMIREVYLDHTIFNELPYKFEAGTPHIAGVIGLGTAIDYLNRIGMENVRKHEEELVEYALQLLGSLHGVTIYGPQDVRLRGGAVTFNVIGIHPHDMAQVLDDDNICIRSGHHCAMPLHQRLKIPASCRASFYIYNSKEDVEKLVEGIEKAKSIFRV